MHYFKEQEFNKAMSHNNTSSMKSKTIINRGSKALRLMPFLCVINDNIKLYLETSLNTRKRNYIKEKSLFNKTRTLFNPNRETIN